MAQVISLLGIISIAPNNPKLGSTTKSSRLESFPMYNTKGDKNILLDPITASIV